MGNGFSSHIARRPRRRRLVVSRSHRTPHRHQSTPPPSPTHTLHTKLCTLGCDAEDWKMRPFPSVVAAPSAASPPSKTTKHARTRDVKKQQNTIRPKQIQKTRTRMRPTTTIQKTKKPTEKTDPSRPVGRPPAFLALRPSLQRTTGGPVCNKPPREGKHDINPHHAHTGNRQRYL